MAQKIITQKIDLRRQDGSDILMWPNVLAVRGDSEAHKWEVQLCEDGQPANLVGQTAICSVVNGGYTTPINATINGNTASVVFTSACYAFTGMMKCMMVVAGTGQTPTVAMLCLRVLDSTTDVMIDENDIIPSYAELASLAQQVTNVTNAETGRASAEAARVLAETARASAEQTRQTKEGQRQTAETSRASAEQIRQSQESTRQSNETIRGTAEQTRQTKEGQRQSNETSRGTAEQTRQTKEGQRQTAETSRASAEQTRQSQESTRQSNETSRGTAETSRASAEQTRQSQESTRQSNEEARNTKLGNLTFTVTMVAPSADPQATTTQDTNSIDVALEIPASNLAYATFEVDDEGDLYMISPEGFTDINFTITDDDELAVEINA